MDKDGRLGRHFSNEGNCCKHEVAPLYLNPFQIWRFFKGNDFVFSKENLLSNYLNEIFSLQENSFLLTHFLVPSRHMASRQHRINNDETSWRCIDADVSLHKSHMPVGTCSLVSEFTKIPSRHMASRQHLINVDAT